MKTELMEQAWSALQGRTPATWVVAVIEAARKAASLHNLDARYLRALDEAEKATRDAEDDIAGPDVEYVYRETPEVGWLAVVGFTKPGHQAQMAVKSALSCAYHKCKYKAKDTLMYSSWSGVDLTAVVAAAAEVTPKKKDRIPIGTRVRINDAPTYHRGTGVVEKNEPTCSWGRRWPYLVRFDTPLRDAETGQFTAAVIEPLV